MKPESLIFDIDGTLWDSRALVARAYNRYLTSIDSPVHVTAERLATLFGKTMDEIADELFACYGVPERYEVIRRCMDAEHELLEADPCRMEYDGVIETLRALAKRYRLFIVSNSEQGYPQLLVEKLGLGDVIEGHLCFGDTKTCKGETILRLMQEHKIASAVYIGDTQTDLVASRLAGIPFVFCRYGFGAPEEFDYAVNSIRELDGLF